MAIGALGYLASDPETLDRFFAVSGLTPATLRQAAAAPGFHAAILDHMLADERLLVAFASAQGMKPESVMTARQALGALYERDIP